MTTRLTPGPPSSWPDILERRAVSGQLTARRRGNPADGMPGSASHTHRAKRAQLPSSWEGHPVVGRARRPPCPLAVDRWADPWPLE